MTRGPPADTRLARPGRAGPQARAGQRDVPDGTVSRMTRYDDDLRFAHVLADNADDITTRRFRALDLRVETKPDRKSTRLSSDLDVTVSRMTRYDDDLRFAHVLADNADDITTRRFRALDLRVETK